MRLPDKPLGPLRRRVWLALGSAGIVFVGLLVAPERSRETDRPPEVPAPMLRQSTVERAHVQLTASVREAAAAARPYVVAFDGGTLGVAVSDTDVLTVSASVSEPSQVLVYLAGGQVAWGQAAAYDPHTELVLVRLAGDARLPTVPTAVTRPAPGDLVFATGESPTGVLIAPAFVTATRDDEFALSGLGEGTPAGAPVFTMGARAAALLNSPSSAVPIGLALERIRQRLASGRPIPHGTGLVLQSPAELGDESGEGAVVGDVLPGSPAAAADLRAGDVIAAVAEQIVAGVSQADALLASSSEGAVPVVFRRAGRMMQATLRPEPLLGAEWRTPPALRDVTAPLASDILPMAAMRAAGIAADARLLSVDGRRPVRTAKPSARPLVAHVSQNGRRRFVVVPGTGS
jgi:S1-C subfamily serine protease